MKYNSILQIEPNTSYEDVLDLAAASEQGVTIAFNSSTRCENFRQALYYRLFKALKESKKSGLPSGWEGLKISRVTAQSLKIFKVSFDTLGIVNIKIDGEGEGGTK